MGWEFLAGLFHPNAWTPAILKLNSGIGKGAFICPSWADTDLPASKSHTADNFAPAKSASFRCPMPNDARAALHCPLVK
jgi:hypothetical protein